MRISQRNKAVIYMLSSTLSLAVTGLITQYLATYFIAIDLALLRFLAPAILLFAFLTLYGLRVPPKTMRRVLLIRAVCIAACQLCFIYALGKLSLIESVVLFATGPLFIALFEKVISRVRLLPQTLVALVLTFGGVILLAGDTQEATLKPELIIGLMAGVFNAGSQLGLHRASKGAMTGAENNAWTFLLASIMLMPVAVLYHTSINTVQITPALTEAPLLYLAIFLLTFMIVNTQVCRYKAYKTAETNTQVAPLIYTNLIFTAVFQFALFDTSFTSMQLFGIGLIVLGNLIPAVFPALVKFKRFHIRQSPSHSTSN